MDIDALKANCKTAFDSQMAVCEWKNGVKYGEPFIVQFTSYNNEDYVQSFDRNGLPVGKPEKCTWVELVFTNDGFYLEDEFD